MLLPSYRQSQGSSIIFVPAVKLAALPEVYLQIWRKPLPCWKIIGSGRIAEEMLDEMPYMWGKIIDRQYEIA